jgi:hypothetical protein
VVNVDNGTGAGLDGALGESRGGSLEVLHPRRKADLRLEGKGGESARRSLLSGRVDTFEIVLLRVDSADPGCGEKGSETVNRKSERVEEFG